MSGKYIISILMIFNLLSGMLGTRLCPVYGTDHQYVFYEQIITYDEVRPCQSFLWCEIHTTYFTNRYRCQCGDMKSVSSSNTYH